MSNYLNGVTGLPRAARKKAMAAAMGALSQAGLEDRATEAGQRVSKFADEIRAASRANREMVENLVAAEVERAALKLGFARRDEIDILTDRLADLEARLSQLTDPVGPVTAGSVGSRPPRKAAQKTPAKKTAAAKPTASVAQEPDIASDPAPAADDAVAPPSS